MSAGVVRCEGSQHAPEDCRNPWYKGKCKVCHEYHFVHRGLLIDHGRTEWP